MKRGWFTLYYGPMFSSKTAALVEDANSLSKVAERRVLVYMPQRDSRRSTTEIVSLGGARTAAIQVQDVSEILKTAIWQNAEEVLIDEVQFFRQKKVQEGITEDWTIVFVIKELLRMGVNVRAAGVNTNFFGHPFPPTPALMAFADDLIRKRALCTVCGEPADWSLRLVNGRPVAPGADLIVVAGLAGEKGKGGETYEARCPDHHPFL